MADVLSGQQKAEPEPPVDDSPVAQMMGMHQDKITRCSKCHTKITSGIYTPCLSLFLLSLCQPPSILLLIIPAVILGV